MVDFMKFYENFDDLNLMGKKNIVKACAKFYEEKTLEYILANAPKKTKKQFFKEPLEVIFVDNYAKNISFGNNVVTILDDFLNENKKDVFFKVAQNSICAVFVHLFYNTASNPNKKTSFGTLANAYLTSITNEFAQGKVFENDIMQAYQEIMTEVMDMSGPSMEA